MKAIITGACGQDGTLLRGLLGLRGYEILGIDRPRFDSATTLPSNIVPLDLADEVEVKRILKYFAPDEIYHLAACHHSSEENGSKFERAMITTNFHAVEVLLSAIHQVCPSCRLLITGSSQMYRPNGVSQLVVDEATPSNPTTFYGHTKVWSRDLLAYYREHRGLYGCMTILFNHESYLRPKSFLTRKISVAAAQVKLGQAATLHIRNIASEVDWSGAEDVVEGMRLALCVNEPQDYVLASGQSHRVGDVLDIAFNHVGSDWRDHTVFEQSMGGKENSLVGNSRRAKTLLGWHPVITFKKMIQKMVDYDIALSGANNCR
jgi:GDPmannose 4,6-dehydratase